MNLILSFVIMAFLEQDLENEASKNKKNNTKDDKKAKKTKPKKDKKWPKEPAVITPNTLPVVHEDFIVEEDKIHQSFRTRTDPVTFQLEPLEINLRQYELKGGIFEIFMVTKPKTTVFSNRIMTWHYKDSKLQYEIIKCEKSEDSIENMYLVSFILPEQYMRWKLPVVCQWEKSQKINYDTFHEEQTPYTMMNKICALKNFQVNKLLSRDEKFNAARHLIPRTISSYKFEMEKQIDNPDDEVKTIKRAVDKTAKTDDELDLDLIAFKWKNPERLFPVISPYQQLNILPEESGVILSIEDEENEPKELFSEVVDELELYNSKLTPAFPDVDDEIVDLKKKYHHGVLGPRKTLIDETLRGSLKPGEQEQLDQDHVEKKSKARRSSARLSVKPLEQEFIEEEECAEEEDERDIEPKWTTKYIFETNFDPTTRKITLRTDRLGVFAWAFDRYVHFPFKKWRLERDKREKDETLTFFIETQFIFVYIWITKTNFRGTVTMWLEDQGKYKTLLKFDNISNFQQLKELFFENHFNIFPQDDAYWYIQDKESFSVKHTALENHTYDCMAFTCSSISYDHSVWNFLSSRRIIILDIKCDDDKYTLKITPENVLIVEIRELCNMLETVDLEYAPTWKNIDFTPDLLSLINSYYSYLPKITDHNLYVNISSLLKAIRFLSYS